MEFQFLAPAYLTLLVVAVLPFFWPKSPGGTPSTRGGTATRRAVLRSLVYVAFVLALAEPVLIRSEPDPWQIVVLDGPSTGGSGRLTGSQLQDAERRIGAMRSELDERTHFVLVTDQSVAANRLLKEGDGRVVVPEVSGVAVDFIQLCELALAQVPDGTPAAVTCLTDGVHTGTDREAARFASLWTEVPLHFVSIEGGRKDARVTALKLTGSMQVGATTEVVATLEGRGTGLDVVLRDLGRPETQRELGRLSDFEWQGRTEVAFEIEPDAADRARTRGGYTTLEVSIENGAPDPGDPETAAAIEDPSVRSLQRPVAVQDPYSVLHLVGFTRSASAPLARLLGSGFDLVSIDAEDLGGDELQLPDLAGFDALLIDDLPAGLLSEEQQQAILSAVTDRGLGLWMFGGDGVFGPGGYQDTALAEVLPVRFVQREEHRDPSTTLALIIDTSGSMGGMRVSLAKEVSRLAMQRLLPHDKVGIVEFYGAKRWAAPIQSAANRIELQRALNRLDAGGGTVILPAIEEAYYALQNVQTRYRHVLILTDGGVERGAFEPLVRAMADEGITVSTVLIGPQAHSEFLVQIANWGRGRFYSVPNRFNLPELLLKQPSTAKLPAYRPGLHEVREGGGSQIFAGLDLQSIPALSGYVETEARPGAEVYLETAREGHPVLASWRYGLGRVTAMTTEPVGRGTQGFEAWSDYGPMLARTLARTASDLRRPFRVRLERDSDRLVVIAESRSPTSLLPVGEAAIAESADVEDDLRSSLSFIERSPGVFTATLPFAADDPRTVRVEVHGGRLQNRERAVTSAIDGRRPERQVDSLRALDLGAWTRSRGTDFVRLGEWGSAAPRTAARGAAVSLTDLWPWFCGLGLLLYLTDVFLRRRAPALLS